MWGSLRALEGKLRADILYKTDPNADTGAVLRLGIGISHHESILA